MGLVWLTLHYISKVFYRHTHTDTPFQNTHTHIHTLTHLQMKNSLPITIQMGLSGKCLFHSIVPAQGFREGINPNHNVHFHTRQTITLLWHTSLHFSAHKHRFPHTQMHTLCVCVCLLRNYFENWLLCEVCRNLPDVLLWTLKLLPS